jgi:intraflagellar transport protein 56
MLAAARSKSAKSRRAKSGGIRKAEKNRVTIPTLKEFLEGKDFLGATTLLEFQLKNESSAEEDIIRQQWLAYMYFHLGEYTKAAEVWCWLGGTPETPHPTHYSLTCTGHAPHTVFSLLLRSTKSC